MTLARMLAERESRPMKTPHGPLRVGIGGPVGSGKTALMDALCKRLRDRYEIAAITNDIYTKWDAEYLVRSGALSADRIAGVETGGCPHTAIREDASINLAAIAEMRAKIPELDLAPYVGASLEVMERDAKKMRGARPFVFTNLREGKGVDEIAAFIEQKGGLTA